MELPPAASPSAPMCRRGPRTVADDGQSGAVNDEGQAGARAGAPKREGEMLTASRARGVIGCREIDAQPPDDRCQDALGLTQRSVEDETERQGGFDGEIGILEVPAPPADASRCPRGDRVGREPAGDVASPHEGSVVLGPVPDAIRCLVLRMHSRLHSEIMTRRRSRWSTCRPLLAHRAESAHQRPIARWLERASTAAAGFNDRLLRDFDVIELQADERCTFIGSKRRTLWLFATIEVCSRLWAGSVLGRRSHRNTKAAINDVILRGRRVGCPLIATDGVEYYVGVMVRLLGSACVYGQVLKTRRNNRVVRVERRVKIGTASRLNAALLASEDSETLNTSFIERLNLTIRQGSAYLRRRSPCHARGADQLRGHVELLRCYYNFIRPHRALRFGRETRTPAMQAGLVSQRLALRDIFTAGGLTRRIFVAVVHVSVTVQPTESDEAELSTRCSPSARRQAA